MLKKNLSYFVTQSYKGGSEGPKLQFGEESNSMILDFIQLKTYCHSKKDTELNKNSNVN